MDNNMKKIIIVNNNMQLGGVQKALYNLLWAIHDRYEITLLLFSGTGEYMELLPPDVKVETCTSLFRYLGVSQGICTGADRVKRGVLAALTKALGRDAVMPVLLASQPKLPGRYDWAISYLQNGRASNFYGGVPDFVLHKIDADFKAAFVHCDYRSSGSNYPGNNRTLACFDAIAACSDGCRRAFEEVMPDLTEKTVTVRNCHRFDEIRAQSAQDPVRCEDGLPNVLMVARLAHEKGIERALEACAWSREQGQSFALHLVGDGPMECALKARAAALGVEELVRFHGGQANPYRYMRHADLLLITSFHEAAPMVIEEARCVGLPVLTVETTSSREMVLDTGCGWVCENTQQAINDCLLSVLSDRPALRKLQHTLRGAAMDNAAALAQFTNMIGR